MSTLGSLVVKFTADIKDLTSGMDRVMKSTSDMGKFAKTSFDVGAKAITAMGTAALAVGVNAGRMAMNFEDSFAEVRKTVDATDAQFQQLSTGIRTLAQEIPTNVNELNKIAGTAGAMGIAQDNVVEFTKVIAQMGTTTNLSTEKAAEAFGQMSSLMQLTKDDFQKLGSAVVALGNNGNSTETQITEMAQRLVGAGKTVGMTTAEIVSVASSMANVGIEAEKGGTAMSKLMIEMASDVAKGGDAVKGWADVSGMSVDKFSTAFKTNAADAIAAFVDGLSKIQTSGGNLFGTLEELGIKEVRLRDTTMLLASAQGIMTRDLTTGREAWVKSTAMSEEAGKKYATTASQLQLFQNKLSDTQITLGTALLPMFLKLLEAAQPILGMLKSLAEGFAALDPSTQMFIGAITVMSAGMYPAVLAIGGLIGALKNIIPVVTSLYGLILAHPFVAIGTAVALLAVVIYKNWDEIHAATVKLGKGFNAIITAGLDPLVSGITKFRDMVINLMSQVASGVKTYLEDKLLAIFGKVKAGIEEVKGYFKGLYEAVVGHSYIPDMVEEIGDHMRNLDVTMTAPARNAVVNTGRVIEQGTATWGATVNQFASTANQTWGSISSTFAQNIVKMTDESVKWGEVVKGVGMTIMTNMLTLVIGLATQWAIGQAMQTAATGAGESARVAMTMAGNTAIVASNGAAATASVGIWGGATAAILGFFATIGAGFAAVAGALVAAVVAVGTFIMGVLSAIAAALTATVFGIPWAGAILVGIGLIAAALFATDSLPEFASGAIMTGPTAGIVGEAGPEATIPLNDRGAKFMQNALGTGGGGPMTLYLQVDSRTMAKAVVPKLHEVIHTKLGYT